MRKLRILGAAFFAVLALSAVSAATASAAHQWLTLGGAAVGQTLPALADGILFLINSKGLEVECNGQFHGSVGPNGTDLISEILELGGGNANRQLISCKVTKTQFGCPGVGSLILVKADNLPWGTTLLLIGTSTYDHLTEDPTNRKGAPGYEVTCGIVKLLCSGLNRAKWDGNDTTGALFLLLAEISTPCSDGSTFLAKGEGIVLSFNVS